MRRLSWLAILSLSLVGAYASTAQAFHGCLFGKHGYGTSYSGFVGPYYGGNAYTTANVPMYVGYRCCAGGGGCGDMCGNGACGNGSGGCGGMGCGVARPRLFDGHKIHKACGMARSCCRGIGNCFSSLGNCGIGCGSGCDWSGGCDGNCGGGCGNGCGGCGNGGCGDGGCGNGGCVGGNCNGNGGGVITDGVPVQEMTTPVIDGQTSDRPRRMFRLTSNREVPRQDGSGPFQRGLSKFRSNSMSDSIIDFEEAAAAEPENAMYHYYRALAMYNVHGADAAQDALAQAVATEQQTPLSNWGKQMERVQGRGRQWIEKARREAGLVR